MINVFKILKSKRRRNLVGILAIIGILYIKIKSAGMENFNKEIKEIKNRILFISAIKSNPSRIYADKEIREFAKRLKEGGSKEQKYEDLLNNKSIEIQNKQSTEDYPVIDE